MTHPNLERASSAPPGWSRAQLKIGESGWVLHFAGLGSVEDDPSSHEGVVQLLSSLQHVIIVDGGLPRRRRASATEALTSRIDCIGIVLLKSGTLLSVTDDDPSVKLGAGDVRLVDFSEPRDWCAADNGSLAEISLYAPQQRFARLLASGKLAGGSHIFGSTASGNVIGATLRAMGETIETLDAREFDAFASAIIDMTIAALDGGRPSQARHGALATTTFAKIRRFIEIHLGSTALTPDLIAGDFGLSRAVLYRMFEPVGGVASYIRRQRMTRALHELRGQVVSGRRISVIARRCGYTNPAVFARAFRETYGVTPRQVVMPQTPVAKGNRRIDWLAPLCGHPPSYT